MAILTKVKYHFKEELIQVHDQGWIQVIDNLKKSSLKFHFRINTKDYDRLFVTFRY